MMLPTLKFSIWVQIRIGVVQRHHVSNRYLVVIPSKAHRSDNLRSLNRQQPRRKERKGGGGGGGG